MALIKSLSYLIVRTGKDEALGIKASPKYNFTDRSYQQFHFPFESTSTASVLDVEINLHSTILTFETSENVIQQNIKKFASWWVKKIDQWESSFHRTTRASANQRKESSPSPKWNNENLRTKFLPCFILCITKLDIVKLFSRLYERIAFILTKSATNIHIIKTTRSWN